MNETRFALLVIASLSVGIASADGKAVAVPPGLVVGDRTLGAQDFEEALQIVTRRRYYHGNVPTDALPALRAEAREALIDRTLLLGEAQRRKIAADPQAAARALAQLDARNGGAADWAKRRQRLRQRLIEDGQIDALHEAERRAIPPPTDAALRTYYDSHRDLFTEPQKLRLAVILLGVEASAPAGKWQAARAEGAEVHAQLRRGADFAALARVRSSDSSAKDGGDMGYLHRGMLPEVAQQAVDRLEVGAITEPITLLSGVAVFRLLGKQPARVMPFTAVRERAEELWRREAYERSSQQLIQRLRANTVIRVASESRPAGS